MGASVPKAQAPFQGNTMPLSAPSAMGASVPKAQAPFQGDNMPLSAPKMGDTMSVATPKNPAINLGALAAPLLAQTQSPLGSLPTSLPPSGAMIPPPPPPPGQPQAFPLGGTQSASAPSGMSMAWGGFQASPGAWGAFPMPWMTGQVPMGMPSGFPAMTAWGSHTNPAAATSIPGATSVGRPRFG